MITNIRMEKKDLSGSTKLKDLHERLIWIENEINKSFLEMFRADELEDASLKIYISWEREN